MVSENFMTAMDSADATGSIGLAKSSSGFPTVLNPTNFFG